MDKGLINAYQGTVSLQEVSELIVSRLVLKNWMNFQSVDIPLSPRAFVMGPNGIGKSNFLDALRFLADIARPGDGLLNALQIRGGFEKIKFAAAKKSSIAWPKCPHRRGRGGSKSSRTS